MSICQTLHCLLLASLWLNTVMHKQTGPAEKLWVCLLACSLTETDAWELCGSPSQSFQLGTACGISSLFQLFTCTVPQATGVTGMSRLEKHLHL